MNKRLITVLIVLILGSLPTMAQTSTPTPTTTPTWCVFYDFRASSDGWIAISQDDDHMPTHSAGVGWIDDNYEDATNDDKREVAISHATSSGSTVTYVNLEYSYTQGSGANLVTSGTFASLGTTSNFLTRTWAQMTAIQGTSQNLIWNGSATTGTLFTAFMRAVWLSNDNPSSPAPNGLAYFHSIEIRGTGSNPFADKSSTCGGTPTPTPSATATSTSTPTPVPITLVQPFSPNDYYLHPSGNENAHIFTNQVKQSVVVPEPVEIRGVEEITVEECIDFIDGVNTGLGALSCALWSESQTTDYALMQGLVPLSNQDIYRVMMVGQDTGYYYNYLVLDPTVNIGDTVDGCTIGSTVYGENSPVNTIEFTPILATNEFFAFQDLTDEYVLEPSGNELPCDTPPAYTECVNTAILNTSTQGNFASSNAVWDSAGVTVATNGYIEIDLNLDLSTDNIAYVYGQGVSANIKMIPLDNVSGALSSDLSFVPSNPLERSATLTATTGSDIVRVRVTNTDKTPLQLFSLCIKTELESINPDEEVETCIFQDREFQTNLFWTVTDGVYKEGQYRLNTGGELEQNVTLATGDYYITIITSLVHKSGYNLDVAETTDGITWEFNDGSGWETIDFISESEYAKENNRYVSSVLFNVATPITLDFAIRATFTGLGTEFSATLQSACLSTTEYDDSGTFLFPQKCGITFEPPSGENLSGWTSWLWANLWEFYECQLMVLLNSMYKLMIQMFETWGWTVRYWQYALKLLYSWLNTDLFPWLNGQFYNISTGRTTTIGSGGCDNAWCFLESLINGVLSPIIALVQSLIDLIGGVLTFLLDVAGGFIGLVFSFLDFIITGLNQAWEFFSEFIGAWNNTPAADLPYIPSCSINPQSNGMCVALWMLENTIFSGRGAIFIPLLTSWGYILLLLWGAKKLKKAVLEAGALL